MGCSTSKLDEQEAVRTCHDRKSFVKKAMAQRSLLASSHVAYVQSLRRVSLALFYLFAEDEHLYFLESSCRRLPPSPDRVLVVNCLRPGGAPVFPVEEWPEPAETVRVDGFFRVDPQLLHSPVSPQPPPWDFFWDPFLSLTDDHRYANDGERVPELEEETDDDDGEGEGEAEEAEEKAEQAEEVEPKEEATTEKEKLVDVGNELRVLASADVEQQAPGFTVYVDRPPASMAEAMRGIQSHFMKIIETASDVSALLEVVPYQSKVQPSAQRDGRGGDEEQTGAEVPEEPFQQFRSHKASLDRLREWEKKLYEEVKAGERVRLSYEKKVAQLKSQDAHGAEPFAFDKTRAAIRDLRTKLNISFTSVESMSKRIADVRDDELVPQLVQLIQGLARMWRVIADAHRMQKRTADEVIALLSSAAAAAGGDGSIRGPPPPPGPTRAATAAGALGAELRSWREAFAAWAESQRGYAAALWGWARSCVSDGGDMPRVLAGWARAVEAVDAEASTKAVDAVAAKAAAMATAGRRQSAKEEWNEEDGKKKVCIGLAAAFAAMAEAGSAATAAYQELVVELEEREREMAGREDV